MVVAAPHAVFDLAFGFVEFTLNTAHVVRFQIAESSPVCIVRDRLPREQFFDRRPECPAPFAGYPEDAARILARGLSAFARAIRDSLTQPGFIRWLNSLGEP